MSNGAYDNLACDWCRKMRCECEQDTPRGKIENEKARGLYRKYEVKKLTNPTKKLECIVLEFDDPIQRKGIAAFSSACRAAGYTLLADDIDTRLNIHRA